MKTGFLQRHSAGRSQVASLHHSPNTRHQISASPGRTIYWRWLRRPSSDKCPGGNERSQNKGRRTSEILDACLSDNLDARWGPHPVPPISRKASGLQWHHNYLQRLKMKQDRSRFLGSAFRCWGTTFTATCTFLVHEGVLSCHRRVILCALRQDAPGHQALEQEIEAVSLRKVYKMSP